MKIVTFLLLTTTLHAQGIPPHRYADIIYQYCRETGIPVYIAVGMAREESAWDERAQGWSKKDRHGKRHLIAGGLFQLSFAHHAEFRDKYNDGVEYSEYDPVANTMIALRYVAALYKRFGTHRKALTYYATGYPSGVIRSVRELVSREMEGV